MTEVPCMCQIIRIKMLLKNECGRIAEWSDWLWAGRSGFDPWQGRDVFLRFYVQTDSRVHLASYPTVTKEESPMPIGEEAAWTSELVCTC